MIQFDSYHCLSEHCLMAYSKIYSKLSHFPISCFFLIHSNGFQRLELPVPAENDIKVVINPGHHDARNSPSNFRNTRHKTPNQYRRKERKKTREEESEKRRTPVVSQRRPTLVVIAVPVYYILNQAPSLGRQCKMANQLIVDGYQVKERQ